MEKSTPVLKMFQCSWFKDGRWYSDTNKIVLLSKICSSPRIRNYMVSRIFTICVYLTYPTCKYVNYYYYHHWQNIRYIFPKVNFTFLTCSIRSNLWRAKKPTILLFSLDKDEKKLLSTNLLKIFDNFFLNFFLFWKIVLSYYLR